ncbi:MAG: LPS export ABC transporter permease LptG [Rhodospirillaceae bacterium]|nr:LPS export ABC transporter permease LptG [Rhodospirillaceae bacterium]
MNRYASALSVYLGTQFLITLAGVLAVFLALILLFDTIELLRRTVSSDDAGLFMLFGMALMKAPHTIQDTLPFAVMIAVMFALFKLTRSHELVIIRAVGVSVWQVLAPSLVLAAAIGIFSLTVFNPIAAGFYATYERMKDGLMRNDMTALDIGDSGFWLRENSDNEVVIVHAIDVRKKDNGLDLGGITILVSGPKSEFVRRVEAPTGELRDGAFHLQNTTEMHPGEDIIRHAEYIQATSITLNQVQDSFAAPETMSFWDLPEFIETSRAAGFSARPHRLYFHSLIATPALLCAMVLLAASFFLTTQSRMAEWTMRGAAGVGAGFVLYFYNQFTYAMGLNATLPILIAAWAPALTAMCLGMGYLFYREDG